MILNGVMTMMREMVVVLDLSEASEKY